LLIVGRSTEQFVFELTLCVGSTTQKNSMQKCGIGKNHNSNQWQSTVMKAKEL